jgi:hypothetical protein
MSNLLQIPHSGDVAMAARLSRQECEARAVLYEIYIQNGINRDQYPYTPQMQQLCDQFNSQMGTHLNEYQIWQMLLAILKPGATKARERYQHYCSVLNRQISDRALRRV